MYFIMFNSSIGTTTNITLYLESDMLSKSSVRVVTTQVPLYISHKSVFKTSMLNNHANNLVVSNLSNLLLLHHSVGNTYQPQATNCDEYSPHSGFVHCIPSKHSSLYSNSNWRLGGSESSSLDKERLRKAIQQSISINTFVKRPHLF